MKYKFRVRLVSKLFPSQKSQWTKWSERQLALPPSIKELVEKNQNEEEYKLQTIANKNKNKADEFEQYDHDTLCQWIRSKLFDKDQSDKSMVFTAFEQKELFPVLFNMIKTSKLNGIDIVYKKPEEYIA